MTDVRMSDKEEVTQAGRENNRGEFEHTQQKAVREACRTCFPYGFLYLLSVSSKS